MKVHSLSSFLLYHLYPEYYGDMSILSGFGAYSEIEKSLKEERDGFFFIKLRTLFIKLRMHPIFSCSCCFNEIWDASFILYKININ